MNMSDQKHLETPEKEKPMPRLENWQRGIFHGYDRLHGNVFGHPNYTDGELIFTSYVVWIAGDLAQCKSRMYQLGKHKEQS